MDRVYPGFRGSSAWQVLPRPAGPTVDGQQTYAGPVVSEGARANPSFTISYSSGDNLTVEVSADDPPSTVTIQARIDVQRRTPIPAPLIGPFEIDPGFTSEFTLDLPDGTYMIIVTGEWSGVGGVEYAFRIKIG